MHTDQRNMVHTSIFLYYKRF